MKLTHSLTAQAIQNYVDKTKKTYIVAAISAFHLTVMELKSAKVMIIAHLTKKISTAVKGNAKILSALQFLANVNLEMTALQDLLHTAAMDSVHMKLVILELNAKIVNNVRKKTKTTSTAAIMCVLRVRNYVI